LTQQDAIRIRGFLGLCQRAGQVILGQDACVDAVRRQAAALVLLDEGSTDVSKKRFRNACASHRVPLCEVPAGLIAGALGKEGRMAAAVRPGTMAQKLLELTGAGLAAEPRSNNLTENDSADIAGVQAEL
jgi:ribosomal protein L7Ae-like RNA K-turn-binding protein